MPSIIDWLDRKRCEWFHRNQLMTPIHGKAICRVCLRETNVDWDKPDRAREARPAPSNEAHQIAEKLS
jgi:hypothetical protein